MATLEVAKSADDLRREIDELQRQQREITERLRDSRGTRKSGSQSGTVRNNDTNGPFQRNNGPRGVIRRVEGLSGDDQRPRKRRLLSAVVKVAEEKPSEIEKREEGSEDVQPDKDDADEETDFADRRPTLQRKYNVDDSKPLSSTDPQRRPHTDIHTPDSGGPRSGGSGVLGGPRRLTKDRGFLVRVSNSRGHHNQDIQPAEPVPRVLPDTSDPNVAKRNRRIFGALLGTLEKFRQEDQKLSGSESFQRRSEQLKRTEQKAQEESERLRRQEREDMAEKRKADLTLRAKLSAVTETKQLELLFLRWAEHHTRLANFIRTDAGPAIYYLPVKPSEQTDKLLQEAQEDMEAWKMSTREELAEHQKQIIEVSTANLNSEIEKWKNGPSGRSKASGATVGVKSNKEGDTIIEERKEVNEIVEVDGVEIGAILVEEVEERVIVGDTEVNKLVTE